MQDMLGLPPDAAAMTSDIELVVGGNFTPAALGLEAYEAVLARLRSRPRDCLRVFESLYLGLRFDALFQSRLHLPALLEHLKDLEPKGVRSVAQNLLRQYDAVLLLYDHSKDKEALLRLVPEETARMVKRLESRRADLRLL